MSNIQTVVEAALQAQLNSFWTPASNTMHYCIFPSFRPRCRLSRCDIMPAIMHYVVNSYECSHVFVIYSYLSQKKFNNEAPKDHFNNCTVTSIHYYWLFLISKGFMKVTKALLVSFIRNTRFTDGSLGVRPSLLSCCSQSFIWSQSVMMNYCSLSTYLSSWKV